jgi:hypothetical protein
MKKLILILVLYLPYAASAQKFAVINDKDGYVNVRKSGDGKSPLVGRLTATSIFGLDESNVSKSDWIKIYEQKDRRHGLEGYIYHDRFRFITSFKSIGTIKQGKNWCSAKNDSISVELRSSRFAVKQHRLTYNKPDKSNTYRFIEKVDGRDFWGTDGEMPTQAISQLHISYKGKEVSIPVSAYNDLYEPRFSTLKVFIAPNKTIYIELDNSDGAGAYTVIWVIKDGTYQSRYIDNSNV